MASIQPKKVHGHVYYQIVQSKRVNGKPRPIVLAHLGKPEDLLVRLQQTGRPLEARVAEFGAVAALFGMAKELQLCPLIEQHAGKRHQGHAVAEYLLLAAISRAVLPLPKTRMARWYAGTVLRRLLPMPAGSLTSQRFWDHLDYLDAEALQRLQEALVQRVVQRFGIDVRTLFFDATNFDTFIDSQNPARLPQRGHAKSDRSDLRIIGLALMVSADFHIPLFWEVYPGNQPDSSTFWKALPKLATRHRQLFAGIDQHITLVFDKGNNSAQNMQRLARTPYHIIGSLVPSQHPDLLAVPQEKFRRLPEQFGKTWVHRTRKTVFGREWTIVVTRSHSLLAGQVRGIRQHLRKRLKRLAELQRKLADSQNARHRGKPYTKDSLEKHLQEIRRSQYMQDILRAEVRSRRSKLSLHYSVDRRAFAELKRTVLGKRILFTDNADWTDEQIVSGYRGQYHVERAFRDMKDPQLVQFCPMFCWTDSKIRVHVFYCVLALILVGLVHRRVVQAGIDISRTRMMEELKDIREVTNLYPASGSDGAGRGRPRTQTVLTKRSALQKRLCAILGLDRLLAR